MNNEIAVKSSINKKALLLVLSLKLTKFFQFWAISLYHEFCTLFCCNKTRQDLNRKNTTMKKRYLIKIFILCIFTLFSFSTILHSMAKAPSNFLPAPPANMDDILGDMDLDAMLEELEEIFGKMDDDDFKPSKKPVTPIKPPEKKAEPAKIDTAPGKKNDKKPAKKLTLEEEFINPLEAKTKLPTNKLKAFYYYMDNLVNSATKLELAINSFQLGIVFKEELEDIKTAKKENYRDTWSKIKLEDGQIKSKKIYVKAFFMPTFTQLRKNIVKAVKELENTNKEVEKFKKSSEEKEEEEIEFLRQLAQDKKVIKKDDRKLTNLKSKIKNLYTQNLKKIADELEKVTTCVEAKNEIAQKVKKREELAKAGLKGKRPPVKPFYRPPYTGGAPWGGGPYGPSGTSPSSWYGGGRQPSRFGPSFPATDRKPGQPLKPGDSISEPSKTDSKGFAGEADKKNLIPTIVNSTNKNIKLLREVLNIYKQDDEKTYDTILGTNKLSTIVSNYAKINAAREELGPQGEKHLSESKDFKINEFGALLTSFIPAGVRLAKHPTSKTEQANAANQILNFAQEEATVAKAVLEYETEVTAKINPMLDFVLKYNATQKELENLRKTLHVLVSPRVANKDKIENIANDVKDKVVSAISECEKLNDLIESMQKSITNNTAFNLTQTVTRKNFVHWTGDVTDEITRFVTTNQGGGIQVTIAAVPVQIDNANMQKVLAEKKNNLRKQKEILEKIKTIAEAGVR